MFLSTSGAICLKASSLVIPVASMARTDETAWRAKARNVLASSGVASSETIIPRLERASVVTSPVR
ncbi:MAG: hypothetical protein RR506_09435, partial [Akkermansia sp.]